MTKSLLGILLLIATLVGSLYFVDKIYPSIVAQDIPKSDSVIVYKNKRILNLMKNGKVLKSYSISLGGDPIGHKEREGDSRTPEGNYTLDWRNPNSKFHLSLHVSYPNAVDLAKAEYDGYSGGGNIMIHGRTNWFGWLNTLFDGSDWTDGCIPVNNIEMEEIWKSVQNGTPISIYP